MGSLWNRSGTIERYADDLVARGAQAFFYQGGTTTPMSVYRDAGESSAFTFPLSADADGRWPDVFVPYTLAAGYDCLVKTADGVQLTFSQNVPNPNPVDVTVVIPPEERVQTGMIHAEMIQGTKTGYVRLNGRTIGSAASAASERANADTLNLFTYLWNNLTDTIAPVSTGRGGSAAADFGANKTIVLPSMQGAGFLGLDDMGAAAAGFFPGASISFSVGNATTPGSYTGVNGLALSAATLPAHTHTGTTASVGDHTHTFSSPGTGTGTTGNESASHTHTFSGTTGGQSADHTHTLAGNTVIVLGAALARIGGGLGNDWSGPTGGTSNDHTHAFSGTTASNVTNHTHSIPSLSVTGTNSAAGAHNHTFTTDSTGSGAGFNNLARTRLVTWYIKL